MDDHNPHPIEKQFCGKCGTRLKERGKTVGYNEYTGEPIVDNRRVCRNRWCLGNPDFSPPSWG